MTQHTVESIALAATAGFKMKKSVRGAVTEFLESELVQLISGSIERFFRDPITRRKNYSINEYAPGDICRLLFQEIRNALQEAIRDDDASGHVQRISTRDLIRSLKQRSVDFRQCEDPAERFADKLQDLASRIQRLVKLRSNPEH